MSRRLSLIALAQVALLLSSLPAAADSKLPQRCFPAIAAATARYGFFTADQLLKLEATEQLTMAQRAVELANSIDCPKDKIVTSVDCIVSFVCNNTKRPLPEDIVDCVKKATGESPLTKND